MDATPRHALASEADSFTSRSGTLSRPVVKLTRLRALREREALSQAELAKKAGVSRATLALIEAGRREPHPLTTRKLAEALGVRPRDLMSPAEE